MKARYFIATLLASALLAGCSGEPEPTGPLPPSKASLDAIKADPGTARDELARAIDRLFDPEVLGETRALIVMHRGKLVAERYAPGYDAKTRHLGWSVSKCVTGIMIGQLVSDGRLRLDETAPVPAWKRTGDPRGEITLRQLLQMRSGLRHSEQDDPLYDSDTPRMLFLDGRDDTAAYAEAQPLESEPGATFEYSSATSVILSDLAARSLTSREDAGARRRLIDTFLHTRFFEPAGMDSAVAEYDATGTMLGSSMIHATARDWAKLGEFLRNKGSVRGAQVIPRRWIEFMLTPSPRNEAYGAQVWLNRPRTGGKQLLFPGRAPETLFSCIGHMGQYVIGSPAQKLTVVRLGHSTDAEQDIVRDRLGDLVALYPVE
ncbi:MAG: serine hydrolase [Sphingomonadaceae bacterium]